jgi:aldehyde:ferredoxin oxidoreductase
LKAIAVRGTKKPTIADPAKFTAARKAFLAAMKESPQLYPMFSKVGTPCVVDVTTALGIFPSKNWAGTGGTNPSGVDAQDKAIVNESFDVRWLLIKMVTSGPYAGSLRKVGLERYTAGSTCA